ncbi:MAG: hypothetical protein PUI31_01705 [Clostridia bacterium]|nr:hypothetical protein [Clostridiales bacterium]MDD7165384.1 hypothetical protein [Clostridia bacterium]MDY2901602.1 hypothetical protein [Christensenellaceae bacterium]
MRNGDIMLGAAIGAVIVGAVVCGVKRCCPEGLSRCDEYRCPENRPCDGGCPCEPCKPCEFCRPCRPPGPPCNPFCCPPEEKPKKKDPCKGCYYEKYERKGCGR